MVEAQVQQLSAALNEEILLGCEDFENKIEQMTQLVLSRLPSPGYPDQSQQARAEQPGSSGKGDSRECFVSRDRSVN